MIAERTVAALFVRADSIYKTMPNVDAWDEARDARSWPGGCPVVAHPPCRGWARLRHFSHATEEERMLAVDAVDAVDAVRRWGGMLEHPAESGLWAHCGLLRPERAPDAYGGWTAEVRQCDWGHRAEKLTWLYIVGVHPDDLPPLPEPGEPTGMIKPQRGVPRGLIIVTKREREATPPAFARWLVDVARLCRVREEARAGRNILPPEVAT